MLRLLLSVAIILGVGCQERSGMPAGTPPPPAPVAPAPLVAGRVPAGDPPALDQLEPALLPTAVVEFRRLPPAPRLEIEARLDPQIDRLAGRQRVWLPNPSREALTTVALRCPANAAVFKGASITITSARWDGEELGAPTRTPDGTGFTWQLPRPWAVGTVGCLETAFAATCSRSGGFHGLMARSGPRWCLYHWHPELPAWSAGAWQLPAVTGNGDESQLPLAHVLARLTVPVGSQVIAGGREDRRQPAGPGWETVSIQAPENRNLAIAIAKDLQCQEAMVGGIRVRSWSEPRHSRAGARALRTATASLALFDRAFGPYPYNELDVVETAQGDGVGGMEASGLVFIDAKAYAMCEDLPEEAGPMNLAALMLEMPVAHEVGHQWWYGIVGNDAFADPWLDESLTNWTGGWALESIHGPSGRSGSLNLCYLGAAMCPQVYRQRLDLPLSGFAGMEADYGPVVYGRGGLMYEALRLELGDQRFLAWLRAWADAHRFGIATPADWEAAVAAALGSGRGAAFIRMWLHGEGLDQRTLMAPLLLRPHP